MNGGESFTARLRRLRREVAGERGPEAAATAARSDPPAAALPAGLVRRLERGRTPAPLAHRATVGPPRDLERVGGFWQRVERLPADARHGDVRLDAALEARPNTIALCCQEPHLERLDPARAVYLDVEATGLSGGSGTYPYLVALLRRDAEGWELWQGFMAAPQEERALVEEVARRVGAAGQIVTFFGKSYDRHRLEDKMRLHRVEPPFARCLHLDLYHPLRRLYEGAEPDGRLQTHERALCGVVREDDLPGAYAPMAWFDFVAGRPHLLEEVFRHNALDVLSLATLTAHLGAVLEREDELPGSTAHRARGLGRAFAARREHVPAAHWLDQAARRFAHDPDRCERLRFEAARELERAGEHGRAARLFERLAGARDHLVAAAALERAGLSAARAGQRERAARLVAAGLERIALAPRTGQARRIAQRLAARAARAR